MSMRVSQRSSTPRTPSGDDQRTDAQSLAAQQRPYRADRVADSALRRGAPRRNHTANQASTAAESADNRKLIGDLKRMLVTSQIDAWNQSSDTIRASIEYDLGHDRRPLDAAAENVRTAESRFEDAERQM